MLCSLRRLLVGVGLAMLMTPLAALAQPGVRAIDAVTEPMVSDPVLSTPSFLKQYLEPETVALWAQVFGGDDGHLHLQALAAVREAVRLEMDEPLDAALDAMIDLVNRDGVDDLVRIEAVKALAELDRPAAAPALLRWNRAGSPPLVLASDPALARWAIADMNELWRQRLADRSAGLVVRRSAAVSLGEANVADAGGDLIQLALDDASPMELRLAAARAAHAVGAAPQAGQIAALIERGQADEAGGWIFRHLAATLLAERSEDAWLADRLLLAGDQQAVVARVAAEGLFATDPASLYALARSMMLRPDAALRRLAGQVLAHQATPEAVNELARLLDDPNPDLRNQTREQLRELAEQSALSAAVRTAAARMLRGATWRGQEQAAVLIGQIAHRPAAQLLAERAAGSPDHVVRVASLWAIGQIPAAEVASGVYDRFIELIAESRANSDELRRSIEADANPGAAPTDDAQADDQPPLRRRMEMVTVELSQAIQTLVLVNYDTETFYRQLRTFIPKDMPYGFDCRPRAAAIWALGKRFAGTQDPTLVNPLIERLTDEALEPSECSDVKTFAAISLARLGDPKAEAGLRRYWESGRGGDPACRWALETLLGEPEPWPDHSPAPRRDWFLVPLSD